MSVLLFVLLTVIVGVTVDYFIQRKKRVAVTTPQQIDNLSLSKIATMLPAGTFLQPSFTWSKILDSGNLMLGIHPVLYGLIGEPDMIDILPEGQKMKKGKTLLTLHKDSKELHIKAPVSGTIVSKNPQYLEYRWENLGKTWLYSIKPENVSSEIPGWFFAEGSRDWLKEKFQQIKNFFIQNLPHQQIGLTMPDGGELPIGILSRFDKKTWQDFESKFFK